ncbi:response regulator [Rheinheimera baltica]|uniref:response regulator n=1 Tax=Rheinheimera baltica TaxID=67576 RepID=UPI0004840ACC|nr:response regulator [Rheinheimera baltica]
MLGKRVMCVDDSPIMLAKLKQLIESLGYEVCATVQSGHDALRLYPELIPDVVTLDITMMGLDGIETAKQLLAQHPDARIVMVTSHGQQNMVVKALKAGAKGYVMKPIDAAKLSEHLARALELGKVYE